MIGGVAMAAGIMRLDGSVGGKIGEGWKSLEDPPASKRVSPGEFTGSFRGLGRR